MKPKSSKTCRKKRSTTVIHNGYPHWSSQKPKALSKRSNTEGGGGGRAKRSSIRRPQRSTACCESLVKISYFLSISRSLDPRRLRSKSLGGAPLRTTTAATSPPLDLPSEFLALLGAQDRPKIPQDPPKIAPRSPQDGPRSPQEAPRASQERPRAAQERPRATKSDPRATQERPGAAQERPGAVQKCPGAAPEQ